MKARILTLNCGRSSLPAELQQRLQSSLECEVKEIVGQEQLAAAVRAWKPDLIFWWKDPADCVNHPAAGCELETVPVIFVWEGPLAEASPPPFLRPSLDDLLLPPFSEVDLLWKAKKCLARKGPVPTAPVPVNAVQLEGFDDLVGRAPAFLNTLSKMCSVADSDTTVLLSGETGVGKEVCARAIHYLSTRSDGPFVPINCGAIPSNLMESELFGHVKGAFTDARTPRKGMVATAEMGSLFLDEIETLSLSAQGKLLRLLQEKTYRPLGDSRERDADIRFLAATNVDLENEVRDGRFRQDLFYRLPLILRLPPLRKRKSDIPLLATHFLHSEARAKDQAPKRLSADAVQRLVHHDWPGNIRELQNVLRSAVLLGTSDTISIEDIDISEPQAYEKLTDVGFAEAKRRIIEEFEEAYLLQLLAECGGNITRAARHARKDRSNFSKLLQKHRIDPNAFRTPSGHLPQ